MSELRKHVDYAMAQITAYKWRDIETRIIEREGRYLDLADQEDMPVSDSDSHDRATVHEDEF